MEKEMDSAARRLTLLLFALVGYGVVTVAFVIGERPGRGIGAFYYLPIALVAFAGGPLLGACAGVLAAAFTQTVINLITFVGIGALIGEFSRRNRALVAELSQLADRDSVTGLPNTRAFQAAIDRRSRPARSSFSWSATPTSSRSSERWRATTGGPSRPQSSRRSHTAATA
jgi:hypothetical protein